MEQLLPLLLKAKPMADGDWWDLTWNPVAGCRFISPGCEKCWSVRDNAWLSRSRTHTEVGIYKDIVETVKGKSFFNGKATAMPDGHPLWTFPLWCRSVPRPLLGAGQPNLIAVCITSDLF